MRAFTADRTPDITDEIWLLEHDPVFTLGQAGDPQHVLDAGEIPVVACDRGGQVTYHGPGQIVMYTLINLRRAGIGVRDLVSLLENTVIDFLERYGVSASSRRDAPGVYVDGAKIAALGLRVSRGYSYHGVALNVDLDLSPFSRINPCGYARLPVTSLQELGVLQRLQPQLQKNDTVVRQAPIADTSQSPVLKAGLELAEIFSAACYPASIPES